MRHFLNDDNKLIGELGDDCVFRKKFSMSKHLLKRYNELGISREVFNQLPEGTALRLKDEDSGTVYEMDYETARAVKTAREFNGYELQYFFPLSEFKIKK